VLSDHVCLLFSSPVATSLNCRDTDMKAGLTEKPPIRSLQGPRLTSLCCKRVATKYNRHNASRPYIKVKHLKWPFFITYETKSAWGFGGAYRQFVDNSINRRVSVHIRRFVCLSVCLSVCLCAHNSGTFRAIVSKYLE